MLVKTFIKVLKYFFYKEKLKRTGQNYLPARLLHFQSPQEGQLDFLNSS